MRKQIPSPKNYRNFKIIFSHVSLNGEDPSPVMAICGVKLRSSYIIPLTNAYHFADSISGGPSGELIEMSQGIAQRIGLSDDRFTTKRIMDAIVDNLPELIEMPPKPTTAKDMMKKVEQHGLKVQVNGETLVDAS